MHTDKARAEFEAAYMRDLAGSAAEDAATWLERGSDGEYRSYQARGAWWGWQASRASVVVELPEPREGRRTYLDDDARDEGWNDCLAECREALEATGLTVEE